MAVQGRRLWELHATCALSGGDSIYGGKFNDEKPGLKLKHDAAGVVAMANSGKNSNTSQFFLTLGPAPQCDGKHVVVGRIVAGLDILKRISACFQSSPQICSCKLWSCMFMAQYVMHVFGQ